MTDPETLLASARRILEGAERDAARGLHMSACAGAQRAAAMATEAWLRASGQPIVSASVHENVCLSPAAGSEVRDAGRLLDRHRIEEGPHGSATPVGDSAADAAAALDASRRIFTFAAARMDAPG
jgi:hypothetical protein